MFLQTNDIKIKKQMYSICNEEKHNIEIFNDLNQTSNGKDGYLETLRLRNIKEKFCKEIQIKQVYKEKSEKIKKKNSSSLTKRVVDLNRAKWSAVHQLLNDLGLSSSV